jgi:tetratricopeptide (TPR) repeat protein
MKTKNKEFFVLGVLGVFCFMLAGCASPPRPLTNTDIDRGTTIFWSDDTITWAEYFHTFAYYGEGANRAALTSTQTDQQKIQWEFVGYDYEFNKAFLAQGIQEGNYKLGSPQVNALGRDPMIVAPVYVKKITNETKTVQTYDRAKRDQYAELYLRTKQSYILSLLEDTNLDERPVEETMSAQKIRLETRLREEFPPGTLLVYGGYNDVENEPVIFAWLNDDSSFDCIELRHFDPNDFSAWFHRGNYYFAAGNHESAIAAYTESIKLTPNGVAYYNRGLSYSRLKDYERAIVDFSQTIRLDPKDAPAYNLRANAYSGKGDYDRAIADYEQAVRMAPDEQLYKDNLQAARNAKRGDGSNQRKN